MICGSLSWPPALESKLGPTPPTASGLVDALWFCMVHSPPLSIAIIRRFLPNLGRTAA